MTLPIVPLPRQYEAHGATGLPLQHLMIVVLDEASLPAATTLQRRLSGVMGSDVPLRAAAPGEPGEEHGAVYLGIDGPPVPSSTTAPDVSEQGYHLEVTDSYATLQAETPAGLHHGTHTFLNLVNHALASGTGDGQRHLPATRIVDQPRFAWRGLSLDVARNFLEVATVGTVLEVMADLQLNVLHLHLSDDQGWRLQLPSHPELTQHSGTTSVTGAHGGFYTQADFAEIVAAAAALGITVVPEFDVPGHTNAALHALPDLNPSGQAPAAYTGIDVGFSRLHAQQPATSAFLHDVFTDLAAISPGNYVHIGGDEAHTLGADEYAELVEQALAHVVAAAKTPVGWQEIAAAELPRGTVVQYWNHHATQAPDQIATAVAHGARVLLSPANRTYLDMKYASDSPLGLDWAGHITARQAYEWEPADVLPELEEEAVIGLEAAIWGETIRSEADLFYLLLPRLAAFAEVAWTPTALRNWSGFADRVETFLQQWESRGISGYRCPTLAQ